MSTITPESQADPTKVPPLDPSLLQLSENEYSFLHAKIAGDDTELRRRILAVQEERVSFAFLLAVHTNITDDMARTEHSAHVSSAQIKMCTDCPYIGSAKYPYPCIQAFHYVSLFMSQNPAYPSVLVSAKSMPDALFLDLGCCSASSFSYQRSISR